MQNALFNPTEFEQYKPGYRTSRIDDALLSRIIMGKVSLLVRVRADYMQLKPGDVIHPSGSDRPLFVTFAPERRHLSSITDAEAIAAGVLCNSRGFFPTLKYSRANRPPFASAREAFIAGWDEERLATNEYHSSHDPLVSLVPFSTQNPFQKELSL